MTEQELQNNNVPLTIKHLNLFDHLEREVAVLVDDKGQPWGATLHVCLSQKSLEEKILHFKRRAAIFPLGQVIDFLLKNNCERLNFYGFAMGDYALERTELEKIAYAIDTFCLLWTCHKEKLTQKAAFDLLKERTFYYLGTPILSGADSSFKFEIDNQKGQENIKLFISEESAHRQNYRKLEAVPVNLAQFKLIVEGKYGLIIEPNRRYSVSFREIITNEY